MTTASFVTLIRIFLIFPIIYLSSKGDFNSSLVSLFLFILASLSDYFDGYIARKTNTVSELGAFLDLLADKLLVVSMLLWLSFTTLDYFIIFPCLIICTRELLITYIRSYVDSSHKELLSVSFLGKLKTTSQMIAIGVLIISPFLREEFYMISITLLIVASLLTAYSFIDYLLKLYK